MNDTKKIKKNLRSAGSGFGEPALYEGASLPVFGSHYNLGTKREDGLASAVSIKMVWLPCRFVSVRQIKCLCRKHCEGRCHYTHLGRTVKHFLGCLSSLSRRIT